MGIFESEQASLARRVRVRRAELDISQEALALRAGVQRRQISEIEQGSGNPTFRTLVLIAQALELSVGALLITSG